MIRQQLIEQLTREIMNYDAEFRREDADGCERLSRPTLAASLTPPPIAGQAGCVVGKAVIGPSQLRPSCAFVSAIRGITAAPADDGRDR